MNNNKKIVFVTKANEKLCLSLSIAKDEVFVSKSLISSTPDFECNLNQNGLVKYKGIANRGNAELIVFEAYMFEQNAIEAEKSVRLKASEENITITRFSAVKSATEVDL